MVRSGFDPTAIQVIPNFLDHRLFPSEPVPWLERKAIVFIGRMTRAKGIFEVLEIAKRMPKEHFTMYGPFESDALQLEFQKYLALVPNVQWLGPIQGGEKIKAIAEAKMTILPSQTEVFPMSILESSFCHTVSAITPVGMVPDLLEDGVDGLFLRWGDPDYNAVQIKELLKYPLHVMKMGAMAHNRAVNAYSLEGVQPRLTEIILTEASKAHSKKSDGQTSSK
ncbi:MAG: glycosyltransferase family 1 protein [Proteobacteria bacterium]|nr:MAG: glycosyltransferase family 1 protein [Pseudomonadota bacterium]